jgi:hypothetical protein
MVATHDRTNGFMALLNLSLAIAPVNDDAGRRCQGGNTSTPDEQDIGHELAGKKVRVTGTLDPKTDTIHVTSIELLSDSN